LKNGSIASIAEWAWLSELVALEQCVLAGKEYDMTCPIAGILKDW